MLPRTLFYALVAINIVLAILLALPLFGIMPSWSAGEPERIAKQLEPDSIRVLAGASAPAVARPTIPAVAVAAAAQSEVAAVQSVTVAQSSPAQDAEPQVEVEETKCVLIKGLPDDVVPNFAARARKAEGNLQVKLGASGTPTTYWVHIPPEGGKDAAEKRLEVLQRNGVNDYFMVRDPGDNQYAISLGLFHDEALAKKRLATLREQGFTTPVITPRGNTPPRLELSGSVSALDKFLATQSHRYKDKAFTRESCGAGR
ncbi:SPOR domain-containing protein [Uliginosibacterium gangwonense]|uniref:SPOR domain-containing protein n=1 Tax=Uliginosibacterium gangwonense TaxID=392736 RepID=UPI00036BA1FF|nr:SPOR domain-containing protein [Uliginosibacterium gangwonense]